MPKGMEELDASILTGALFGYGDVRQGRLSTTVEAIRRELGHGPFLYRYLGEDGVSGREGAFLTCSFWLVEALVHAGRTTEAADLMERSSAWPMTSGSTPRRSIPRTARSSATSPRPSRTWR